MSETMDVVLRKAQSFSVSSIKELKMGSTEKTSPDSGILGDNNVPQRFSPLFRQLLASAGPILLTTSGGMVSGFSAILLPQLDEEDSMIQITEEQASWIASMAALPMAVGCILSGILIEKFGRKTTQLITSIPLILGWAILGYSWNIEMILIGRFITGLCVGLMGPACSVYISEMSDPKYRGFLLAGVSLAIAAGLLIAHLLGTFIAWQLVAYASTSIPMVCIIMLLLVPESPAWLMNHGKLTKAEDAFFWARGRSAEAAEELHLMLSYCELQAGLKPSAKNTLEDICKPGFWKPLLIINFFFISMQLCGVNAVAFYSVTIMQDTLGKGLDRYAAMLIIDTIRMVFSIIACCMVRKYERRPLAIISALGTAVFLVTLSIHLYYSKNNPVLASHIAIPLTALIGYIVFVTIGMVPLPWAMMAEVFPQHVRGIGSGISSSMNFVAFFAVVKTSPSMFRYLDNYGTFMFYGIVAFVSAVVLFLVLPETKGKTLHEIENHFKGNKKEQQHQRTNNVV